MSGIIECVPNFSNGRNPEVVDQIVQSIMAVEGVSVLHRTSDFDHNRSVITFAGSPRAVAEAAFSSIATAATLINLDEHEGVHPRIGATDVVPFVPIKDFTMSACVELARQLGQRVWDELHIPVYLYEEAAIRPERKNLANVRRGEYEGLKKNIHTPEHLPDIGEPLIGKAGAVVIGARQPLIAFNVFLNTPELHIAQEIAKAVRHSSGGMAGIKALGLVVNGLAQVSMNLVDYKRSPLHRVVEMIRREAQHYGTSIHHTELIGLIPQDALLDAASWYLQMQGFSTQDVLENRLFFSEDNLD
jgi:glutamate formiminotransferase / formiminotetrahydrofolate cyclodeaminase